MTDSTPVPDTTADPVEDMVSSNPDDIQSENVYMSLSWVNVSKPEAIRIRDAALAAADPLSSYSVTFSSPIEEE